MMYGATKFTRISMIAVAPFFRRYARTAGRFSMSRDDGVASLSAFGVSLALASDHPTVRACHTCNLTDTGSPCRHLFNRTVPVLAAGFGISRTRELGFAPRVSPYAAN